MRTRFVLVAALAAALVVFINFDFTPRQVMAEAPDAGGEAEEVPPPVSADGLTATLAVRLRRGADGARAGLGARHNYKVRGLRDWRVLRFESVQAAAAAALQLAADPDVLEVVHQRAHARYRRVNDPLYPQQWHLKNTGQGGATPGIDLNVEPVWNAGNTGTGVRVAIVDDGLQHTHEDLASNYSAANSWDYVGNDSNPAPGTGDDHGTACAGLVAAKGDNGIGVAGAAYNATLSGIRLLGAGMTDATEAAALTHDYDDNHIYSNSWGPFDNGDYTDVGPLAKAAIEDGVVNGRGGRGNIYVWAGGNGRQSGDYANYDGYVNLPETICVASLASSGQQASYSESGACIMVSAPGSEGSVVTTDRTGSAGYSLGNYVSFFNGTSAACPMVAGVVALMLAENPYLTWRDVQHILARTSTKNHAADSGWALNGAGFNISHKYGFGLINAEAAVNMAANWTNVASRVSVTTATDNANVAIPDNNSTGIDRVMAVATDMFIEHVVVNFTSDHTNWGDLQVTLTSPDGTVSELARLHFGNGPAGGSWRYMSTRHWGENTQGNWTLNVADRLTGATGNLTSWSITFHGTAAEVPAPLVFTDGTPPDGQRDAAYSYTFTADGGTPPYSFAVTDGSLPTGLTLDSNTGELAGTPDAAGIFHFTVTVTTATPAASGSRHITLVIQGLHLVNFSPPGGVLGTSYSYTFTAANADGTPTFSISAGSAPTGLTLDGASGQLSGIPSALGTFNFTIMVATTSPTESDSKPVSITITAPPLTITNLTAPAGVVGTPYTHTYGQINGVPPLTFAIISGTLPPGLTLDPDTGTLSGTPTAAGNYSFVVSVSQTSPADQSTGPSSINITDDGGTSPPPPTPKKKKEEKKGFLGCAPGTVPALGPLALLGLALWAARRRRENL